MHINTTIFLFLDLANIKLSVKIYSPVITNKYLYNKIDVLAHTVTSNAAIITAIYNPIVNFTGNIFSLSFFILYSCTPKYMYNNIDIVKPT